jgi:hypothetical protein
MPYISKEEMDSFFKLLGDRIYRINWIFFLVSYFPEENEEKINPENHVNPVKKTKI